MKYCIFFFGLILFVGSGLLAVTDCDDPSTFPASFDEEVTPGISWAAVSSSIASDECKVYKVNLIIGEDYTFKTGCGDGATAEFDTYIVVYDSTAALITENDDGCESYRSKVDWTATETVAYVKVRGYNMTQIGAFTLAYLRTGVPSQVYVPDDNFRAVINNALGQPAGYQPTILDLNGLTGNLNAYEEEIVSIEGAQYLTGLEQLRLDDNSIVDIAPIAGLTDLDYLDLGENEIIDVSPVAGLVTTSWLYLDNNEINEISALSGLIELTRLYLFGNEFSDIYPLVENAGLDSGDVLRLERYGLGNPLSVEAMTVHVPILVARGVSIDVPDVPNNSSACYPVPNRDAVDTATNLNINWQGNFGSPNADYDVYLGTSPDQLNFAGTGTTTNNVDYNFNIALNTNTDYWWKVLSTSASDIIWSGLWHFTTGNVAVLNAEFEADQTSVYTGSLVQFTDLSTGNPTQWAWDFNGDLIADSYDQNPTWTYSSPGVYTVNMEVTDGSSYNLETKVDYITVTDFAAVQPIGAGTPASPYQVENLANLLWISQTPLSWDKYFVQTADIDAADTQNWNGGDGFNPIGTVSPFIGSYDGQDHIIDDLYINRNTTSVGFFCYIIDGDITNLGLTNVNISGGSGVGGIVGYIEGESLISNCYTTGSITAVSSYAGGIAGFLDGNLIPLIFSDCYSSATVDGGLGCGGLAGYVCCTDISKCYATGSVTASNTAGGLIGYSSSFNYNFSDCYATGSVDGDDYVGGLVGLNEGPITNCYATGSVTTSNIGGGLIAANSGAVTGSYWNIETSGQSTSAGGEGKTTAEMMLQSTYVNWPFTTTWFMENGINNGYPFLEDIDHFQPCWSGNGYQNMQIFINTADIKGVPVEIGDEIGVFDGDLCVGGGTIYSIVPPFLVEFVAASDDPLTLEIDGFISGNPIEFHIWDNDASIMYTNVSDTYLTGTGSFAPMGYALVDLHADDSAATYPLLTGWNLGSFNIIPFDYDMEVIMDPLIVNGSLVQVQDESGNNLCNLPGVGWFNSIGDMMHTEGYYININQDDDLVVPYNHLVLLPLDIPFTQGWNIMGFPYIGSANAQEVVQSLINSGDLVKVIAESGDALWYDSILGTWINDIGDMNGGKGYFINVNADCVLTFVEPTDCIATKQKLADSSHPVNRESVHFQPVWNNNPFLPMNIYIYSVQIPDITIEPEDELAAFDGNICVGAAQIESGNVISLIVSRDDPISETVVDGFIEDNEILFKFWDSSENIEYSNFTSNVLYGNTTYYPLETSQFELTFQPTGNNSNPVPLITQIHQNYPNPFNPETNIAFSMKETGHVTIEIFNLKGQKVTTLTNREYEAGSHSMIWQSQNETGDQVSTGVYFYKFKVDGKTKDMKKMLLLK